MCLEIMRSFAVSLKTIISGIEYPFGHPRRSGQAALAAGSARWLSGYDGTLTDDLADLYGAFTRCVSASSRRNPVPFAF